MSDHAATPVADKPLFTPLEVEQFDADDVVAGAAIGKMLSMLFLYTVLAMTLVSWWTFSTVSERHEAASQAAPADSAEPAHH
ncbi:MAG: hypothetical protein KDA89_16530 [Planctomycetaceae bacterium]|nr:hypothetical protein [Planctomycetaceae bacterium]